MANVDQDVSRAIAQGEFYPWFQPLILLRTGQLQGFEILARWHHPKHGLVQPSDFIPSAEEDGWIDAVTSQLLAKALSSPPLLNSSLTIAVNISPVQLRSRALPEQIHSIASGAGFPLDRLIIEITENALFQDIKHAQVIVHRLKDMGCKLALDDFGTGYSSLLHLQSLPFDELKVDRSFVNSMTQQRDSRKIVAAVVGLGQSLGLTTVAEGVETQEQAEMLAWLGCEIGQGWLFGKPVPAAELPVAIAAARDPVTPRPSNDLRGHISLSSLETQPTQRLAQLQAVYEGAPVGLAFLDRNMRYLSVNRRLADMNGFPMEGHLGRTPAEVIPDLFPVVEVYIRRALNGHATTGVRVSKPASENSRESTLLLSYEPVRDEAAEVVGVSVSIADITDLQLAEDARRESEEHFRHMMELIPQIPWIIDPQGRALDVSQRWLEITGMTDHEWRGHGWLDALHPEDVAPTQSAMQHAFQTGEPIDIIYRVRRPGGDWKRLRSRGSARFDSDGKILCWYGSLEQLDQPD